MAKRKRDESALSSQPGISKSAKPSVKPAKSSNPSKPESPAVTLQIVTGSYERVLHGFTALVSPASTSKSKEDTAANSSSVQFVDSFLFEAHGSAIRSLALSPLPKKDSSEPPRVILASGSTDERINLYSLSASPPAVNEHYPSVPTLAGNRILENPKNRELGSLFHHSAGISALHFPSRSKLLAASEDNTISVTKTRDWSVVSTIKAPRPKVHGRPDGDTAPPGGTPSGVNDFAVHPSMKLMLSVGRGEKCMRLWNLMTGKKAGVLNFNRELLQSVKEGKWSSGEGRKVAWNSKGEEFAIAFEWGAVVFGIDSTPTCAVFPSARSKLHQMKYIVRDPSTDDGELLAVSTEDGRVTFYSTKNLRQPEAGSESPIPYAEAVAQLGGKQCGLPGRVKDFDILSLKDESFGGKDEFLVVTGSSDGTVRVWKLNGTDLTASEGGSNSSTRQAGQLLGTYETGDRITCLKSFVMMPSEDPSTLQDSEEETEEDGESETESDEDD